MSMAQHGILGAAVSFETVVPVCQTTLLHTPEDYNINVFVLGWNIHIGVHVEFIRFKH
jgi:hypothetical protein